jgi:single-strand DNA-binding protein
MNLNKAMLIGNLTADPEVRTTPSGQNVASFSLATNFVWKDQQGQKQTKAEFHNIVAWGKLADIISQYLKKGAKVYIEGRLQTQSWVGQQDNIKRYKTEINAENMIMLDRAGANTGGGGQFGQNQTPMPTAPETPVINIDEPSDTQEDEIKVENIPF